MKQGVEYFKEVIKAAVDISGYSESDILGKRRHKELAKVRQACMYTVYSETSLSLPEVGRLFNRDHTTVLHACQVKELLTHYVHAIKRELIQKRVPTIDKPCCNAKQLSVNEFLRDYDFSSKTC